MNIENNTVFVDGIEISITISAGIYEFQADSSISGDEILKHADQQLYSAKHEGRNRVIYSKDDT